MNISFKLSYNWNHVHSHTIYTALDSGQVGLVSPFSRRRRPTPLFFFLYSIVVVSMFLSGYRLSDYDQRGNNMGLFYEHLGGGISNLCYQTWSP
jgi:hypothetical protein